MKFTSGLVSGVCVLAGLNELLTGSNGVACCLVALAFLLFMVQRERAKQ